MIKPLGKIGVIGAKGGQSSIRPVKVEQIGTGRGRRGFVEDLRPQKLRELEERVGSKRAARVWRLLKKGVVGTLPELCAYDWLQRKPWLQFEFQSSQLGGRMVAGGAVVDFLISGLSSDGLYCWRIQGEYWHAGREREAKDATQKMRLLSTKIGGVPVVAVVDLWEMDVYDRYPEVFERAEFGVGLRG